MSYSSVCIPNPSYPINFLSKMGKAIQVSIHNPSQYICANCEQILPDWKQQQFLWVVVVLQQAQYPLVEVTGEVEKEKERLREKFMRFGCDVAFNLRDRGYVTDLIDPRTGYPLLSHPGAVPHDDTAVVKALLGYSVIKNKCSVLVHPEWGTAVYPSVLLSEAPPEIIVQVMNVIAPLHGWTEIPKDDV